MKTKIILTALALSLSVASFAQEKITLQKRITNYSMKIDSIVSSEQKKMDLDLNSVEKKFKDGQISEVELRQERSRISTNYSEVINAKINAEKEQLDEITKASAMNTVMGIEKDSISKRKMTHPKDLLKSFDIPFSAAFLNITDQNKFIDFSDNSDNISVGKSRSSNIGMRWERQIGKFTSSVFYTYGLNLRSDSYNLKGSRIFTQENNQLAISPFTAGDLKYSRIIIDYLEIPLDLSFVLNPKYIEYEGEKYLDATKNQFRVGAGVYGGVKVGNRIRYKYSNVESRKNIAIQRAENGLNDFEFGARISVGYAGFNLYIKKDFTPAFNDAASLGNKYPVQIGLELVSLNL